MSGQVVGYRRVSSLLQNTERQLDGIPTDKIFQDKLSGKDTNRPQLQSMLEFIREGDIVLIHSLDRLGRNLDDLRCLVNGMIARGVTVKFLKENLTFSSGDNNIFSELMLNMLASFAQFERSLSKERQREGVQIAKANLVYAGKGRKQEMSEEKITELRRRISEGEAKAKIARGMHISRDTLYRYLNK